ncbi:MAG: tetratricopeptide repeat protein [Acidobacteria bacterium]|nr:tetratricopeptide repeat protein [Acidobacteriota bacterium]
MKPCMLLLVLFLAAQACLGQAGVASADTDGQFIEQRFSAARQAENLRDYPKAEAEYRAILAKFSDRIPELYQNLGVVLYLQKRHEDAIGVFQEGIRRNRRMQGAQLFLGICLLAVERYKEALPHLQAAHAIGATPETRKYLAIAHIQTGNLEGARQLLLARLRAGEDLQATLYQLGDLYLRIANQEVHRLTDQAANLRFGHLLAGRIFEMQDFHQLASREYLHAVQLDPANAAALLALSRALFILGQEQPARVALERYNALLPDAPHPGWNAADLPKASLTDVGAPVEYGKILASLPTVTEADCFLPLLDRDVREAVRVRTRTDRTGAWKDVARHLRVGRWAAAAPVIRKLGTPAGTVPSRDGWVARYLLVRQLMESDDYAGAEAAFEPLRIEPAPSPAIRLLRWTLVQHLSLFYFDRLLREYPGSAHAHFVQARTWRIRGKREALDEFRAAIAADPEQPEIRMALASYLLSNAEYDEALAVCQEELRLNPYSTAAKGCIGRVHIEQQRPELGIQMLEEVLRRNPGESELRSELARALEMTGETTRALEQYETALSRDPSLTRLHYVLSRLYRRAGQPDQAQRHLRLFQQSEENRHSRLREQVERFQSGDPARPAAEKSP